MCIILLHLALYLKKIEFGAWTRREIREREREREKEIGKVVDLNR